MTALKTAKKEQYMNSLEKYHIQKITNQNLQLSDTQIDIHNPIFDVNIS
jgi:hypothetical protein